ncbi:DNA primase [Xanthomonas phage Xop411]|uniref:p42 n=1 Tax=Xanthomonas phage Xop411 TaxID=2913975 RepID=A5H1L1_9CAUD|nr:DNA primase [Xanthomonas phage Xop411]ABK00188.1 p42 [Xanthomonas phage Xop411]
MATRMTDEEWLPQAQSLLVGGRNRATGRHADCGSGSAGTLGLYREGNDLSAYCHRCGAYGSQKASESPEEMLRRLTAADAQQNVTAELPECTSRDPSEWPKELAFWCYKYGLHTPRIRELGLYYSKKLDRIVLPLYSEDGRLAYWQARSETLKPKWLGPPLDKRGLVMQYGKGRGRHIVLTEDAISAYKVSLVSEAWSLLGTKLHARHAARLLELGKPVIVWLDNDTGHSSGENPGQVAAQAIVKQLRAYGLTCYNVLTDHDPKCYNRHQIRKIIDEVVN